MPLFIQALRPLLAVAASLILGLGSALYAVRSAATLDATTAGSWQAWARAGTPDWDPYSRARMARSGELPLGTAEGLTFTAWVDQEGDTLLGNCRYAITGQTPQARLWTVEVQRVDGRPAPAPRKLRAIGGDTVLRRPDDTFTISVAPRPVSGNWLSSAGVDAMRLVLRLYDTPIRTAQFVAEIAMPDIVRDACQ